MRVFVLSREGYALMPTTPRRARLWLKARRARVVRRDPFTIQLRFETTSYTQPVTVGVDTGSKAVGLAALANGEVLLQAEVQLRTDISEKLAQRRTYRRARRSRKMRDPEISGLHYQQGTLFGYQVREYLLTKWQRACAYCGAKEIALQVEHIVPKARGGSDRVDNLTLACEPCNQRKGNKTAAEFGFPQIQTQARLPLRDAAHVSALKTALLTQLRQQFGEERVQVRYGYQTKYHRIQILNLPKSHAHDAVAIACEEREVVMPLPVCWYMRCLPRGSYQRFNGKRSEHKCWAPRKVRGWKLYERVRAKGLTGYIAGRREKGAFVLKDAISGKTLLEVTPRKLERVARPTQGWMITRQVADWSRKEGGASSPR